MHEYDLNSIPEVYYASSTTSGPIYAASKPLITISSSKFDNVDDKIKEYEEKLDKHVEQLEEDIQFFNEERLKQEEAIKIFNVEKDKKIKILEDKCNYLEEFINHIVGRLAILEAKEND